MLVFLSFFVFLVSPVAGKLWESDLKRAKTWTPRSGYRGRGTLASANAQLNKHLAARAGLTLKACEDFSVFEVRDVLKNLLPHSSEELRTLYREHDGRHAKYQTVEDMELHWASSAPTDDHRVRDAHCHEAVMWFIHHLTSESQAAVAKKLTLPMLPIKDHVVNKGSRRNSDEAGKFYDEKVTCQKCHVGGIDNLGVPEVAPDTARAKARRCYTNYKELFGITCGPCDGIAGPYWGDSDKDFSPTECIVVAQPEEVPEKERVPPKLPEQFKVDVVGGSDRFGRTTNPVHDQLPGPIAKIYGQINGTWAMDAKPGADLWLLRHDTSYNNIKENGVWTPFNAQLTEIHSQTAKQRSMNSTGPMVSLIHGIPDFVPGGCTCMPDPVGVPDITASWAKGLANMQYMGRIKLPELEYLKTPIELDHWADWFFHIFMDTNKSVPHYGKAPSRLASAYAGTAVYANWVMEDPAIKDPEIWRKGIPTSPERVGPDHGKFCMNTKKDPMCDDISQKTFPPKGEPAGSVNTAGVSSQSKSPFFASAHSMESALLKLLEQKQVVV